MSAIMMPDQTSLVDLHQQLPEKPGKNFCIAPFQSIRQNPYGKNSPCAFGAGEWQHGNLSPVERWNSVELNQLRQEFINGQRPTACHRCWSEEDAGKTSLRQRQYQYFPNDYEDFIRSGQWMAGPRTAVFKSSNVCNLACRSCGGWDTNTYAPEGHTYASLYNTQESVNGVRKLHNRFIPLLPPKHMDFMQYKDIAHNLEKIDFFGGEPFLNITQLDLLEYLVNQGLSQKITLFYSTNCTNYPTDRLKRAWNHFRRVEISMSIDGTGKKFEYLRWPAKWEKTQQVMNHLLNLKNSLDCEVYTMSGLTLSVLNMFDADDTYEWLQKNIGSVYVNMVNSPDYLSAHIVPDHVKSVARQVVKHPDLLGYMDIKPHDPVYWKQVIIWTKRQDLYRNQKFESVFPDFFEIIKTDWNSVIDLSEKNFNL
jgi:MoaA/NifB/PqqE/SkfB family radical SAM enzyme/disulfide oxidoreductase YuzD